MPYSASRGLLYTAPPNPESNRRPDADEDTTGDVDAAPPRADEPDATAEAAPTPADD